MSVSFSSSFSLSHTLTHTHLDTSSLPGAINQWKQALKYLTSEPGCRASAGIFTHNIATREEAHAHTVSYTDEHDLAPFCSFFFFYVIVNPLIFCSFRQICYYLLCLQNLYRLNVCFLFVCVIGLILGGLAVYCILVNDIFLEGKCLMYLSLTDFNILEDFLLCVKFEASSSNKTEQ